jgi:hypothetical protein
MSYNHALILARLDEAIQEEVLNWLPEETTGEEGKKGFAVTEVKSIEDLKSFLMDELSIDIDEAPFDLKDEKLLAVAGSCAKCPKNTANNNDLLQAPEGYDKDYFKTNPMCCDKFCFAKKLDIHLKTVTENQPKDIKQGAVGYSNDSSVIVGGTRFIYSKTKTKECFIPVLINKQQNGKKLLGTVVFIPEPPKKATQQKSSTSTTNTPNRPPQPSAEEKRKEQELARKEELREIFAMNTIKNFVGAALYPKKSPVKIPAVTPQELFMVMLPNLMADYPNKAELFITKLILKFAHPEKTDEEIQELVQDLNMHDIEKPTVIEDIEKETGILKALSTLPEASLMQLYRFYAVSKENEIGYTGGNIVFHLLRTAGEKPEAAQEIFVANNFPNPQLELEETK